MNPIFCHIGAFPIHWFGVMMALGFLAGLFSWVWIGRREGRDFAFCSDFLFWIMISGVLGARLADVVADWKYFLEYPRLIWRIDQGGLSYYGGLIGGVVAVLLFARARREDARQLFDFVASALPLSHAFGRVGCFLNGCCHGTVYHGPLAVTFPRNSVPWLYQVHNTKVLDASAPHSLPVHPVQLYEAAFLLLLYALLVWSYRRQKRSGTTTALYLILYPIGRFVMEFFRGDERLYVQGLTSYQVISLVLLAAGLVLMIAGRGKVRPAATAQPAS
jgi:phosphatidylglycerol:prolipoprotein diacylglycerol transferase